MNRMKLNQNPNLMLKETIVKSSKIRGCKFIGNLGYNDIFDIYYPLNEIYKSKVFLAKKSEDTNSNIEIIDIESKEIINQLKNGHMDNKLISMIKYFGDIKTKNEYLISSSNIETIVWDLNQCKIFQKINFMFSHQSYSSLILFNYNNKLNPNLLIISYSERKVSNFIYNFETNQLLNTLIDTESLSCFYLLRWDKHEKKEYKKTYVIACCDKQIIIYDIYNINGELIYSRLKDKNKGFARYYSAYIVSNFDDDYLYTTSDCGTIYVWDLNKKHLIKYILCNNFSELYGIVDYNENYLMTGDIYGNLFVIDVNINKIICKYNTLKSFGIVCLKKIMHPIYGRAILTCGRIDCIELWTTI